MTIRRADQFTARAIRGVAFNEGISLYVNGGTYSAPGAGDGLDLSGWTLIAVAAHPVGLEGVQYALRGTVIYEFTNPARILLAFPASELEKAVVPTPTGVELRPIRLTVRATNAALQQRTVLQGVIHLLPGGFTQ